MEKGRFAPSPSGRMHLGNLMCSLLAWLSARASGGQVVLRIEDLDAARCPRTYADLLEQDLAWLGLVWDEGGSAGGPDGPYYQSERFEIYKQYYDKLNALGLVYPCFCSRSQLHAASAPHRADGQVVYPGTCRGLSPEEVTRRALKKAPAWRVQVPDRVIGFTDGHLGHYEENLAADCGDFYLRRADGVFAYQLAVVTDDGRMGINQVVRGRDLLDSTPRQIWLQECLGLPRPAYYHTPLLCAPDGRRLSKREKDLDMGALRSRFSPRQLTGRLAALAGLVPPGTQCTPAQLVDVFDWNKIGRDDVLVSDW